MVTFAPKVERWRVIVNKERGTIPTDLILAIITRESGGDAGEIGRIKTKSAALSRRDGSSIRATSALGLMQVIPPNLRPPTTYDDMIGATQSDARIQIQEGVKILRSSFLRLHRRNPVAFPWPKEELTDQQVFLGLASYVYGSGRVQRALDELKKSGRPQNWDELVKRYPRWGEPKNHPIRYVSKISKMLKYPLTPAGPPPLPPIPRPKAPRQSGPAGVLALLLLAAVLS